MPIIELSDSLLVRASIASLSLEIFVCPEGVYKLIELLRSKRRSTVVCPEHFLNFNVLSCSESFPPGVIEDISGIASSASGNGSFNFGKMPPASIMLPAITIINRRVIVTDPLRKLKIPFFVLDRDFFLPI